MISPALNMNIPIEKSTNCPRTDDLVKSLTERFLVRFLLQTRSSLLVLQLRGTVAVSLWQLNDVFLLYLCLELAHLCHLYNGFYLKKTYYLLLLTS